MRKLTALIAFALAVLTSCGTETSDSPHLSSGAGSTAAVLDFEATTVEGDRFDASSLAGKPTVFWFWAPWCPTCRAQAPGISALADEYGDRVNFVGVGSLDSEDAIAAWAEQVPALTQLVDPDGAVWRHFSVSAQSTYLVLDEHGTNLGQGYLDDSDLARVVDELAG